MNPIIRPAHPDDLSQMAEIYNQGIRARTATFETRERSSEDLRGWLGNPLHPVLVSEQESNVVGWITASSYRLNRPAYAGIAEFSVYVHQDNRGQGIGDGLMAAFIPACEKAGLWKLVSRIFPENTASLELCRKYGFREVGVYRKHGKLEGVWRDVIIVECLIEGNLK